MENEIKVDDLIICMDKENGGYFSIDKVENIIGDELYSKYISSIVNNVLKEGGISYIPNFDIIKLYEYFENPEKYEKFYEYHDEILFLWNKYMEYDVVEARKYKLKKLEEYGN